MASNPKKPDSEQPKRDSSDDDSLEKFHASLWRMPAISLSIPMIAVNEQQIQFDDIEPKHISQPTIPSESTIIGELITNFEESSRASKLSSSSSSSDSNIKERLVRENNAELVESSQPGIHHKIKLWRRKLIILIWLNFLMRYRKHFVTFVELIFPIVAFGVMCGGLILNNIYFSESLEINTEKKLYPGNPYHPFSTMSAHTILNYACSNDVFCANPPDYEKNRESIIREFYIVYSPNNTFTDALMSKVRDILMYRKEDTEHSKFYGVPTPKDVENKCKNHWDEQNKFSTYPVGVDFSFSHIPDQSELTEIAANRAIPKILRYTIRTVYSEISNTAENYPFVEHSSGPRTRHEVSPYIFTGFAGMQLAIDLAFVERVKDKIKETRNEITGVGNIEDLYQAFIKSISLKMFEYPFFISLEVQHRTWSAITMVVIMSYVCTNFCVVQSIVLDAKSGKMELLKLHGLTPALHWTSFGINTAIMRMITSCFMTITFYFCFAHESLLEYPQSIVIFCFLFLYGLAQDFQNLFIALWFNSPTRAGMYVVLKSFVEFLIPMRFFHYGKITRIPNVILSLFAPQWCLANGLHSYLQYEIYEDGLYWFDFPILLDTENYRTVSIEICCILFLYSSTFYLFLTIYADRVLVKPFAPAINWLYCLQRCRGPRPENTKPSPPIDIDNLPHMYEQPPIDLLCTVRIRNLCKTYNTEKTYQVSLDNINLDIFEGEILAVVGHGGSGKTTLLHLIAGLIDPTSGYVEMKNLKVHENSDFLNQYISICPQKCMLFSTLSVEDHVRLCCMVHGISYRKSKTQAKMLLQLFSLNGFRRHSYEWLSYTHVKKLAMAMALASTPTILILDEPTQGMDTEASKTFWRHLLSLKTKRTIIVSTSRMEDIELYCDRMALLVQGQVVCYGTPGRIKRHYDIGSVLNLRDREGGDELDTEGVVKIINSEVKGAIKLHSQGYDPLFRTHRYMLPCGQAYAALLEKLEDDMENLKFNKMWMTRVELTSMYHKISLSRGIESALVSRQTFLPQEMGRDSVEFAKNVKLQAVPDKPSLQPTAYKQFSALFTKKWLYLTKKHKFCITEFIPPILLMILIMFYSKDFLEFVPESLSRPLQMKMYTNSLTLIRPVSSSNSRHIWFKAFSNAVGNEPTAFVPHTVQMSDELMKRKSHTLTNSREQTIVAFERDSDHTYGYYSSNSFHSCPIALNTLANSFLYILSLHEAEPYKVQVSNFPIQRFEGYIAGSTQSNSTTIFAFMTSIVLALIAAAELRLPILEQHNGIKTLELMSGVYPAIYWITNACGDFLMNALLAVILTGIMCIFSIDNRQFSGPEEKYILALIYFGYLCWASPPYSYFLSSILTTASNGYGQFLVLHFFFGIIPKVLTYQMLRTNVADYPVIAYIFHIFPPYTMTSALVHYFHIVTERNYCPKIFGESLKSTCDLYGSYKNGSHITVADRQKLNEAMESDHIFRSCCKVFCEDEGICHETREFFVDAPVPTLRADMRAMAVQGLFYWAVVLLLEYKLLQHCCLFFTTKLCGNKEVKQAAEDTRDTEEQDDVKKEHLKVNYMIDIEDNVDSEIFLVQDITKFFKDYKCIDHAFFSIPAGKTTGILGLSKSGMTTLIKLITAQLQPSSGYIYIDNALLLASQKIHYTKQMGLVPQNNAYYPELTGFQTLQLIGKLRGISDPELDIQVTRWIDVFELQSEANIKCKHYRPGVLRRICCAMAMIGSLRVVIMDHPTLNMDIREQHIFWKAITEAKEKGQTTIFTSSYSEEVQQSANKVIILDEGAVVATGGLEDVFKYNARGFVLSLRCRAQAFKKLNAYQIAGKVDQLRDHIIQHLSPCELLLDGDMILVYQLKDLTTKLSYAYGIMEGAREKFPNLIDNFHINEPSLDDVVLNFHKASQANRVTGSDDAAGKSVSEQPRNREGSSIGSFD